MNEIRELILAKSILRYVIMTEKETRHVLFL